MNDHMLTSPQQDAKRRPSWMHRSAVAPPAICTLNMGWDWGEGIGQDRENFFENSLYLQFSN